MIDYPVVVPSILRVNELQLAMFGRWQEAAGMETSPKRSKTFRRQSATDAGTGTTIKRCLCYWPSCNDAPEPVDSCSGFAFASFFAPQPEDHGSTRRTQFLLQSHYQQSTLHSLLYSLAGKESHSFTVTIVCHCPGLRTLTHS
eukprot:scpid31750/ scgid24896/ 